MVSSNKLQVYQIRENRDGRGISTTLFVSLRYLDDPPFTQEQQEALHEICESFLLTNRMRERNRNKAARRRKKEGNANAGSKIKAGSCKG